jgi:hypothetical protein
MLAEKAHPEAGGRGLGLLTRISHEEIAKGCLFLA